jgi:translocation and assembly module TamB
MRYAYIISLCLSFGLSPLPAASQDEQSEGWIENILERSLSGESTHLEIEGMEGAFSSAAQIDRMVFSDLKGEWLIVEGAILDWTRSALTSGRLQVNELTAQKITLTRFPEQDPETINSPEAQSRSLPAIPHLPIGINLGKISVKKLFLGESIAGEKMELSVFGKMSLENGGGEALLNLIRLDADAEFALQAGYKPNTNTLSLDLLAREASGGIVSQKIGLNGSQDILLSVKGNAPIDKFNADISLSTDGQDRLTGSLEISRPEIRKEDDLPLLFSAILEGDLTPILPAELHPFFGSNALMKTVGVRSSTGALSLQELKLKSAAMQIDGQAVFDDQHRPQNLDLKVAVSPQTQDRVLLPFTKSRTKIRSADLNLDYDRTTGEDWKITGNISGLLSPEISVEELSLTGSGTIKSGEKMSANGSISLVADGFYPKEPGQARASGSNIKSSLVFEWEKGAPTTLSNISISGDDYGIVGTAEIWGLKPGGNPRIETKVKLNAARLSRFSGISGRPLTGSAFLDIQGSLYPVSGEFELFAAGQTNDLTISQKISDAILRGRGTLNLKTRRNTNGLQLEALRVETRKGYISGQGRLSKESGQLNITAQLNDGTTILEGVTGPTNLELTADRRRGPWHLSGTLKGPGGLALSLEGTSSRFGDDLHTRLTGQSPMGLINPLIAPRRINGIAKVDLRLDGPPEIDSLSGTILTQSANFAMPTIRFSVRDLSGQLNVTGETVVIDLDGAHSTGGDIRVTGSILLKKGLESHISVSLEDIQKSNPELFKTTFNGDFHLVGSLLKGGKISGKLTLQETDIRIPDRVDAKHAKIPGLSHEAEPDNVLNTRKRAGLVESDKSKEKSKVKHDLDLLVSSPSQIFVRGRGLEAELGGSLRLHGTTNSVIPEGNFTLKRGRLEFLGKKLTLTQGHAQIQGTLDPFIRFIAEADTEDGTVRIEIEGQASNPKLTFSSASGLPEDEALSLLLFGKYISEISALQAVRLGAAIRTLTGGREGFIKSVRNALSLDDLTIGAGKDDNTEIGIGKNLTDEIYTEASVVSDGEARINLNLSPTKNLKARGHTASSGTTGIGLVFEKNY